MKTFESNIFGINNAEITKAIPSFYYLFILEYGMFICIKSFNILFNT